MPLKSCSRMRNNMRLKAFATLLFASAIALVAGLGVGARAQRRRAPQPSANDNTAQASQNDNRPKHVFIGHGSDTASGSRMTVTSDNPLNDYRAYRSGDRFYVELPNANADTSARASGRGFSDMQVQRRGKSVVLSYRIQPGAKPHVEQRFNRLEVVFDASDGAQGAQGNNAAANNSANRTAANAAENRTPNAEEQSAGQTQSAQQNPNSSAAERRAATQAETAGQTQAANAGQTQAGNAGQAQAGVGQSQAANAGEAGVVAPSSPAGEQAAGAEQSASNTTAPSPEQTTASPAPTGEQQLAQSQPPSQIGPITASDRNAGAQSGASFGTFLLRNWELSLVIALAIAGFGLLLAARRSSAAPPATLEEAGLTTQTLEGSRAPSLQTAPASAELGRAGVNGKGADAAKAAEVLPVVAASALVGGAAVEEKEEAAVEGAEKLEAAGRDAEHPAFVELAPDVAEAAPTTDETSQTVAETSPTAAESATTVVESAATIAEPSTTAVESSDALVESQAAETPVAESSVAESSAVEPSTAGAVAERHPFEESLVEGVGGAAAIGAASVVAHEVVGEKAGPEATAEVAAGSASESSAKAVTEIAPAEPPEQERVEAETRRLLEGGDYDREVIGTNDPLARQLIAAELLSALSGRNAERRARARAAFNEHGYFDELARDLHMAEAPAERAAAARFLALSGERAASPHLIAALEDESSDVRRASVEALGALRDPSAVRPLERLLESESGWRNRVPSRVIRHALETCREAAAEERAAAHAPARPAPEAAEVAEVTEAAQATPAVETAEAAEAVEAAPAAEATSEVQTEVASEAQAAELARAVEPAVEEAAATREVEAVEAATEVEETATKVEAVGVEEAAEVAPTQEPSEVVAAQAPSLEIVPGEEAAHAVEPEPARETTEASSLVEERAVAPYADEVAEPEEVFEPESVAGPSADARQEAKGIEPVAELHDVTELHEFEAAGEHAAFGQVAEPSLAFEEVAEPSAAETEVAEQHAASTQVVPFVEEGAALEAQETHETQEAVAPHAEASEEARGGRSVEITPAVAGEWFDFELEGARHEAQPSLPLEPRHAAESASQPSAEQPAPAFEPSSVFESSSGGALTAETEASESAPASQEVREVERYGGEVLEAEAARGLFEPGVKTQPARAAETVPPSETAEKGVAPFDEFSTVPASIQQRLASRDASERAAAIIELSHADTDEAFQQICAAFDDDSKDVRSAAARALYELRDDRAESFTRALREAAPERRRHIGSAIAASGLAGDAVSQLTGESREKTYEAFSLLFLMAKAGEVQPLVRAIEAHPNSEVRLAVVKLLALSGQKEILPAFRRLAVRGSLPTEVRSAVMEAIYQISSSQSSTPSAA
jgi:HEAT repeats